MTTRNKATAIMKNKLSPYGALASIYEKAIKQDYVGWADFIVKTISTLTPTNIGCDAACGSGYFTRALKKYGFNVYGADLSDEMLSQAKMLSDKEGLNIAYFNRSLISFKSPYKLGFVTVINDGFNYLNGNEVLKALKSIYASLESRGVLLFDISSEYKLRNILGNNLYGEDDDEFSYLWFNELEDDHVKIDVSVFEKEGEMYRKREESQIQYIHTMEFIEDCLYKCGFNILSVTGKIGESLNKTSDRIVFTAIK